MSTEICFTPATELAARIRQGELSPVTVVNAFLDRIEEKNDEINAYVTVLDEEAREAAKAAEQAVENGDDLGPLHGVPVAIKDLSLVEGVRTTFGSVPFEDHVPEFDSVHVHRLKEAGAIILGKTNVPEHGLHGTTDNNLFGATSTPFAPGKNAGGSGGGSAAAVAAGLAPIAQGSDGGGSIRIPSALTGSVGMKDTHRRVPLPRRPDGFLHTPFNSIGPHARCIEDMALMLDVMAGYHPRDPYVTKDEGTDFRAAVDRSISGWDVAYSPDLDVFPIDDRVSTLVDDAVGAFESAGATVEEISFGWEKSLDELFETWELGTYHVGYAIFHETMKDVYDVDYLDEHRDDAVEKLPEYIETGQDISAVEYKQADVSRTEVFDLVEDVFESYDLLVTPTVAVPAVDNASDGITRGPAEINGKPVDPIIGWCLTYPFNLTGHPAASVPAGFTEDGLPVGLQIVGQRFEEGDLLAASASYQQERPWDHAYPPENH